MHTKAHEAMRSAESVGFMDPTVGQPVRPVHPFPHPAAKLRQVGLALGISEAKAEKLMWGPHAVNITAARIIEVLLRRGDTESVAVFLAPIDAALAGGTGSTVDALLASAEADCREDCDEARYHAHPSPATAAAWIRSSAIERSKAETREKALRMEWGLA